MGQAGTTTHMFYGAASFNQDLSEWDTGELVSAYRMFQDAMAFDQDLGGWNVSKLSIGADMFSGTKLSQEDYEKLLIGWSEQALKSDVEFDAGSSNYSIPAAVSARNKLVDTFDWSITDGGAI